MLDQIMSMLAALNNNVLWGIPMVVLMIGTGVFLLIVTKGAVFTRFNVVMRYTTKTLFNRPNKSELEHGAISPFQAIRAPAKTSSLAIANSVKGAAETFGSAQAPAQHTPGLLWSSGKCPKTRVVDAHGLMGGCHVGVAREDAAHAVDDMD